jgi:hypothetical protein
MDREQLIRICLNSGVVRRDVAINLIETIEENQQKKHIKLCDDLFISKVLPGSKSHNEAIKRCIKQLER